MKITKRQLRNLVKEEMPRGGVPDVVGAVTGVYGEKNRRQKDPRLAAMDYKEWARDYMGTPSGANSSSVLATYAVDQELSEEDWMPIALAMDFTPRDVGLEIARQQKEYDAGGVLSDEEDFERGFKESNMRISKKYLKKIINEEIVHVLSEQAGGQYFEMGTHNGQEYRVAIPAAMAEEMIALAKQIEGITPLQPGAEERFQALVGEYQQFVNGEIEAQTGAPVGSMGPEGEVTGGPPEFEEAMMTAGEYM
jgi:hypothetical protein